MGVAEKPPHARAEEPPRVRSSGSVRLAPTTPGFLGHGKSVSSIAVSSHAMDGGAAALLEARERLKLGGPRDGWINEPEHFLNAYYTDGIGGSPCAVLDTTLSALLGLKRAAEFASHCALANVTDTPVKLAALVGDGDGGRSAASVLQAKLFSCEKLVLFVRAQQAWLCARAQRSCSATPAPAWPRPALRCKRCPHAPIACLLTPLLPPCFAPRAALTNRTGRCTALPHRRR